MERIRLGFIGFGEAAYHISKGLLEQNQHCLNISAYDAQQASETVGALIQKRAVELGVHLCTDLASLLEEVEVIFCATNAQVALGIAKQAAPYLTNKHLYVDLNSTSPMLKQAISAELTEHCSFIDVAVMESVPKQGHRVPLLASGQGVERLVSIGQLLGMQITSLGTEVGAASAIKMFRSVFMKGMTMLLYEMSEAAQKYGVLDEVMNSLDQTLRAQPLEMTAELLIGRTKQHAGRRIAEMEEVIETLSEAHVDYTMSEATKQKLLSFL